MTEFEQYLESDIVLTEKELTWKNYGIMSEAEQVFMEPSIDEICERIHPKVVLETGFGLGMTAERFQKDGVTTHIIVEAHPKVFPKLQEWASSRPGVMAIHSTIQNLATMIGVDLIYDDRAGLPGEPPMDWSRFDYKWFATMPVMARKKNYVTTEDLGPERGFYFETKGVRYYQRLERAHEDHRRM